MGYWIQICKEEVEEYDHFSKVNKAVQMPVLGSVLRRLITHHTNKALALNPMYGMLWEWCFYQN